MIRMTLCPNCRVIQKHGDACSICKCPVNADYRARLEDPIKRLAQGLVSASLVYYKSAREAFPEWA